MSQDPAGFFKNEEGSGVISHLLTHTNICTAGLPAAARRRRADSRLQVEAALTRPVSIKTGREKPGGQQNQSCNIGTTNIGFFSKHQNSKQPNKI